MHVRAKRLIDAAVHLCGPLPIRDRVVPCLFSGERLKLFPCIWVPHMLLRLPLNPTISLVSLPFALISFHSCSYCSQITQHNCLVLCSCLLLRASTASTVLFVKRMNLWINWFYLQQTLLQCFPMIMTVTGGKKCGNLFAIHLENYLQCC